MIINRCRSARQNHSDRTTRQDIVQSHAKRENLAINAGLSHSAGDELGVLRAKIQYDYDFVIRLPQKIKTSMTGYPSNVLAIVGTSDYRLAAAQVPKQSAISFGIKAT